VDLVADFAVEAATTFVLYKIFPGLEDNITNCKEIADIQDLRQ
jgi:hypothetical protein